jgi:hypothetical protein
VETTQKVYGVAAVPEENDPDMGHLVIITEAGLMNALQLYQEEEVLFSSYVYMLKTDISKAIIIFGKFLKGQALVTILMICSTVLLVVFLLG